MEPEGSSTRSQELATCPDFEPDQSSPCPHPTFRRSFLILSSHLRLRFQVLSFPHVSPPKSCIQHSSPLWVLHAPLFWFFWFDYPNNIWWGLQIIKLLVMSSPPLPCYLVPLRPKYSPQHPVLKHPQPTFIPQFERSSFTPTQNNRQNYSYSYIATLTEVFPCFFLSCKANARV